MLSSRLSRTTLRRPQKPIDLQLKAEASHVLAFFCLEIALRPACWRAERRIQSV
jgi:hypothetical protein